MRSIGQVGLNANLNSVELSFQRKQLVPVGIIVTECSIHLIQHQRPSPMLGGRRQCPYAASFAQRQHFGGEDEILEILPVELEINPIYEEFWTRPP